MKIQKEVSDVDGLEKAIETIIEIAERGKARVSA